MLNRTGIRWYIDDKWIVTAMQAKPNFTFFVKFGFFL